MSGHFIPLRKNAKTLDRRYRVYTPNVVETQEIQTVKGRDALRAVDATEVVESVEGMDTTEGTDVQGTVFCL